MFGIELKNLELDTAFRSSSFYPKAAAEMRYARYQIDPTTREPLWTNREWRGELGLDVWLASHGFKTLQLANWFIQALQESGFPLETNEGTLLLLASLIHDWGESIVGDTTYDLNGDSQIEHDRRALWTVIQTVAPQLNLNPTHSTWHKLVSITHPLPQEGGKKLPTLFKLIERVRYLKTGVLAWHKSREQPSGQKQTQLAWLTHNMLGNQIPSLVQAANLAPVRTYLAKRSVSISEAFSQMPEERVLDQYRSEDSNPTHVELNNTKFQNAKRIWTNYLLPFNP